MKCGILSKLTIGPCLAANGNSIDAGYKETQSIFLKADVPVQDVLLVPAQDDGVAVSEFGNYLKVTTMKTQKFVSHDLAGTRYLRVKNNNEPEDRVPTFVSERICCVPSPATPMDRMADVVPLDAGESDTEVASDFS